MLSVIFSSFLKKVVGEIVSMPPMEMSRQPYLGMKKWITGTMQVKLIILLTFFRALHYTSMNNNNRVHSRASVYFRVAERKFYY